ncbi:MAG: hypothetical protein ABL898_10365 [Hyphomicrobiaceae bacterium]
MQRHALLVLATLAFVPVFVMGCGHVPVASMWKLRNADAMTVDPAIIRVAVRAPAMLVARPRGAKLIVKGRATQSAQDFEREFVLEQDETAVEPVLLRERSTGEALTMFRISTSDVPVLRSLQAQTRSASGAKGTGSIGVKLEACRRGPLPAGPLLTTTYLKLDVDAGFVPVLAAVDLRRELDAKQLEVELPPCS